MNPHRPAASVPLTLLFLAYAGFISLGLPDAVQGIAWPQVRGYFSLEQSGLGFILAFGGAGYLLSSFFTGMLLRRMSVGTLLFLSTGLVATGLFGYSGTEQWWVFLACASLIGLGSGAIDGGLNSFVSKNLSARHMAWLHGCYGIGASLGPILMTNAVITSSWRRGFLEIAGVLLLLAFAFALTRKAWLEKEDAPRGHPESAATLREALSSRTVILQALAFFFYTGAEATVGQWSFTLNTEARGVPAATAGLLTVSYWVSLTAGRFLMGFLVARLGSRRLLAVSLGGAVLGTALGAVPVAGISALALILTGASFAAVYPLLMAETPERVGARLADHAIGLQVSAGTLGVMIGPSIAGYLSEAAGLGIIPYFAIGLVLCLIALQRTLTPVS